MRGNRPLSDRFDQWVDVSGLLFGAAIDLKDIGNGRTDGPTGNAARLYDSIHRRVFILPEETTIYPGHDEKGE